MSITYFYYYSIFSFSSLYIYIYIYIYIYLIAERDAFYSMSNVYPEIYPTSAGIYMTNAFDISEEDIGIHDHIDDDNDHVNNDGDGDDGDDSIQHHSNSKATTTPTSSTNNSHSDSHSHISGMFLAIGRLNHSCIPNAQQTFIPLLSKNSKKNYNNNMNTSTSTTANNKDNYHSNNNHITTSSYATTSTTSSTNNNNNNERRISSCIGYEVLYATRDIIIGEEINDCYIELRQSRKDRRKELMSLYRFKCVCKICSINDEDDEDKHDDGDDGDGDDKISKEMKKQKLRDIQIDDDRRRQRAMQLDEAIYEFLSMGEYNMAQDIGTELIKLLEHKKSIGWG